jgi:hypothetical protein
MSQLVKCPKCGAPMYVPAFEGDGVYETHECALPSPAAPRETPEGAK